MSNSTTLKIDFSLPSGGLTKNRMFEILDTDFLPTKPIVIAGWARTHEDLENCIVTLANNSIGAGVFVDRSEPYSETLSFSKRNTADLRYPPRSFDTLIAESDIVSVTEDNVVSLFAPKGTNLQGILSLVSFQTIGIQSEEYKLVGTVTAVYTRGPFCREWTYTPSNNSAVYLFIVSENSLFVTSFIAEIVKKYGSSDWTPDDEGESGPKNIIVKDFVTGALLQDVEVYVNEVYKGKTDEDGLLVVNAIVVGTPYNVKLVKPGYIDSDLDDLDNDDFVG